MIAHVAGVPVEELMLPVFSAGTTGLLLALCRLVVARRARGGRRLTSPHQPLSVNAGRMTF